MCSAAGWETSEKDGLIFCHYMGERMSYDSAVSICQENGMEQSWPSVMKDWKAGPCGEGLNEKQFRSWAASSCNLKVKVSLEGEGIAIVHEPGPDKEGLINVESKVNEETLNFFSVPWEGLSPTESDCLAIPSCHIHGAGSCICDVEETESVVYSSASEVASQEDLMNMLHIGVADIASFDDGIYTNLNCNIQDVAVYSSSTGDSCTSFSVDTVFAFERNHKAFFLGNIKSVVSIPESTFSFRNPVQFISLSDPELRDAYYETEEVLDSLFYHPSHAPFLALRLIQRFGISNPSPGFVERVVDAYKSGSFSGFGLGQYGDLQAMIAAILLDPEHRRVVLDADPT